ncbi:MAG: pyridoxal-phosphate dependent enzyme, partial [Mesorhizobium sp.]
MSKHKIVARDDEPSRLRPPYASVLDLIGQTPVVELTKFDTGKCRLFIKLESQNPGGSIKDR